MIARLTPLWALAALLALWELAVALLKIPASQLPPPSLIVATLYAQAPQLLDAAATTLGEALLALALAGAGGVALALLFSLSPLLERAFLPVAVALQVTPLIAVAPLLLIYLEPRAAVLACAALVAFFPVLSNAAAGLRGADRGLVELFRLKGASRAAILFRLRLPSALPSIFTGLRIGAGLALIGAVAAELAAGAAGQGEGLAFRIVEAGYRLKVPTMYAAVLLLCLCGVALYGVLAGLDRILLRRWRDEPDV
ncbi:NitT/TauT family transport system permease protein [Rhodoblastus acidophilus]|uniref:NitT/TauT family transport system permease protein n=1 Tax=Rhodoblastus acidophilus TaxID=1074 RepID=A0A212QA87_RHOAC|nr:ABC transporter permease subunit [Rhodoblastus acidophilus]MCW2316456.1 NitT/TauT family transport system permease protein [Rhodoblastus acidophilus]RAI21119.1 ABC transporter ATP-binding protein [Rhodoblastus acidophilus]SNB56164.1 NitT/TauT family transport system permease protein [Rhodoblastus acidophilus]